MLCSSAMQLDQAVIMRETEYLTVFQLLSNSSLFREKTGSEMQRIWSDFVFVTFEVGISYTQI